MLCIGTMLNTNCDRSVPASGSSPSKKSISPSSTNELPVSAGWLRACSQIRRFIASSIAGFVIVRSSIGYPSCVSPAMRRAR